MNLDRLERELSKAIELGEISENEARRIYREAEAEINEEDGK
jgi:hypothetical protein